MPSGVHPSEEVKTEILRLRAQGLTYKVIGLRTRLYWKTIYRIIKEEERKMANLYSVDDIVASCNACGAYTLTRNPTNIKHYPGCGGLAEVEKWDKYYSSPGWIEAATEVEEVENVQSH